jgi:hypothetical protein
MQHILVEFTHHSVALLPIVVLCMYYWLRKIEKQHKKDMALTKAIFELLGVEIEFRNSPKDLVDASNEFGEFGYKLMGKVKGYFFIKGYNKRGYFESYVIAEHDAVVKLTTQSEPPQGEREDNG